MAQLLEARRSRGNALAAAIKSPTAYAQSFQAYGDVMLGLSRMILLANTSKHLAENVKIRGSLSPDSISVGPCGFLHKLVVLL